MEHPEKKTLIVMAGPTAVGKTNLAIALAKHYHTEIISTDARQFYQETQVGTAKPSAHELQAVKHHLVDFLSIHTPYDVKQFEIDALAALEDIFTHHNIALATGGSGLYLKTLCEGIDEMPDISPEIREKWNKKWQEKGIEYLTAILQQVDPEYFATADLNNPRRVLRALEVYEATGLPYSAFRQKATEKRYFQVIKIGLQRKREALYDRINQRVDHMLAKGLEEEARLLYPYRQLNALQTVGYQEWFPYFEHQYDRQEAIRLIKRNSRRYAKRQMTWFRKDPHLQWFDLTDPSEKQVLSAIIKYIDQCLNS